MSKRISLLASTLILGLVLPAAAQEQLNGSDSICKSMGPSLICRFHWMNIGPSPRETASPNRRCSAALVHRDR
jgi:hypothetical protein